VAVAQQQVKPMFPKAFHRWYYAVAAMHAFLGITAEALGLHIVIVAGTNVLPQWLRFTHWKPVNADGTRALVDGPS
jgi:hypothetical protein